MIFGGCDGKRLPMSIAAVLLIVTVLIVYYIAKFSSDIGYLGENFASGNGTCGGRDQLCTCGGSETMTAHRVTDSELARNMAGFH